MITKKCTKCKQEKSIDEFGISIKGIEHSSYFCKTCNAKIQREYYRKHPDRRIQSTRKWEKNNKLKKSAHWAIDYAVQTKKIIKPTTCQVCHHNSSIIEAHHYMGYEKENRLNVLWVCRGCHKKIEKDRL